jgi:hypothetical protein
MGIHAAGGNGFRSGGRINYSIGIEVVGHYTHVQWPAPVAALVGHTVAALKHKLGTFELKHQPFVGGVSSHRDYNKPSCPGDAITNDFYIGVLREGWSRFRQDGAPAPTPAVLADISPDMPILGPDSGTMQQAVAYIKQQLPASSEYSSDVEIIMGYYWQYAPGVGLDPFLAACQCIFETDALRSRWAGRPRRNPAGLGVRQEGGLSFETWEDAVQAHIGQLLAYALTDEEANEAQRQMMSRNPRHHRIPADHRGQAKTLTGLNNRWTDNPQYADGLVSRAQAVRGA